MRFKQLACLVAATVMLGAGSARAQLPWPGVGTEHLPPDPTEAAHQKIVAELIDPALHPSSLRIPTEVTLEDELHHRRQDIEDATDAEDDQHDREYAPLW